LVHGGGLKLNLNPKFQTIFCFSYVWKEAKLAFSVFSLGLSHAVVFYAALDLQPSFFFLTRLHQLSKNTCSTTLKLSLSS
jgi:hypothetical protein